MKLSIYIPTLQRDVLFDRCFGSIERSIAAAGRDGLPADEYEICVVEGVRPLSEARNEGLRRTTGEWIACVDADDMVAEAWFGEVCKAIAAAERDGEIDDIVFDMTIVRGTRETNACYARGEVVEPKVLVDDMLRDLRIGNYAWLHVTRRRLWRDERFELVPVMEDYVTMHRVLARARKTAYVAKPLYRYVVRAGSLCNGGAERHREIFEIAVRRAESLGGAANIGTMVCAYNILYDGLDRDGSARQWIRSHSLQALCDREVPAKWKLKFALAAFGIVIKRSAFAPVRWISILLLLGTALSVVGTAACHRNYSPLGDLELRYNENLCAREGVNPFHVWHGETESERFCSIGGNGIVASESPSKLRVHAYPPWHMAYTWFYGLLPFSGVAGLVLLAGGLAMMFLLMEFRRQAPSENKLFYWAWMAQGVVLPAVICCLVGNYGLICAALSLVLIHAVRRNWQVVAGIAWALMMTKPQLAVLFVLPLLFQRKYGTILVAAGVCVLATLWPTYVYGENLLDLILQIPLIGAAFETNVIYGKLLPRAVVPIVKTGWLAICVLVCGWMTWRLRKSPHDLRRYAPVSFFFPLWMYSQSHDHVLTWVFLTAAFPVLSAALDGKKGDRWRRRALVWLTGLGLVNLFLALWSIGYGFRLFSPAGLGWVYYAVFYAMESVNLLAGLILLSAMVRKEWNNAA